MVRENVEQAMGVAVAHHQAGQFAQAETIYRQVLAVQPNHAEALHLLGVIAGVAGQHAAAADLIRKAITISPRNAVYQSNLGMSLLNLSQSDQAITAFKRSVTLDPNNEESHFRLATVYFGTGQLDAAILNYQKAITINPRYFDALHNFANALNAAGQFDRAIDVSQRAIALNPTYPPTLNNLGNAFKGKGNLLEAIASYRRALVLNPNYAEAHNNLGNTLQDTKEFDLAIASYKTAIELIPNNAEFYCNLGTALMEKEEVDLAIETYRKAIELDPNYAKALCNLAAAWTEKDELDKAIECNEKAIALQPEYFDALLNLGVAYVAEQNYSKALEVLKRAAALRPDSAEVYNNLGVVYRSMNDLDQSVAAHEQSLRLNPKQVDALNNMGNIMKDRGQNDAALRYYHLALEIEPDNPDVLVSVGNIWKDGGRLDQAKKALQYAISIKDDNAAAFGALGGVCQDMGQIHEAIKHYRKAIELDPKRSDLHEGLLFGMLYDADTDPVDTRNEHIRWYELHSKKYEAKIKPMVRNLDPQRRLKIGFISGDFRRHSVMHFFQPILEEHDRTRFEYFCYANIKEADAVTRQLQATQTSWRDIIKLTDDEAADLIRDDQIDILVELGGHTAYNRLPMLSQKPAPILVNYQGYPATTGIGTFDYRITDLISDPPGMTDDHCTEELLRLPRTDWVYRPPPDAPEVMPTPALKNGFITFGSLNYFGKISDVILDTWMRTLATIPSSRLIVKSKGLTTAGSTGRVRHFMERHGIRVDRVELIDWIPPSEHYLHFGKLDISLDSYPYHGTTTTCETLWMGVPVIALAGRSHVCRVSASLLTNMGLKNLVATSPDQYIQTAVELAGDIPRLADLRAGMRQRMIDSPLMDYPAMARDMEVIYRNIWQRYCREHQVQGSVT